MQLFQIPEGIRVRITSKLIRWVERHSEQKIAENLTWEATTTDRYFYYKGAKRRLLVDHTVDFDEYGIWQRDTECEIIPNGSPPKVRKQRHYRGVLVNE